MNQNILLLLNKFFYHKPIELKKILKGFKRLEGIMEAPKDAFFKLGVKGAALDKFIKERNIDIDMKTRADNGDIITVLDKRYPEKLKNLYDFPPILFYKGDLSCLDKISLAVIGSRKMTEYGKRVSEQFVKDLCQDFVIISGLAYGIDGLAHKITVNNNKKTIAVLGSGLNNIYPSSNIALAQKIVDKGGLVLSECPPDMSPQKFHFPMRNRIIAGLSNGILIIEAGKKSGTLITAKLGIDYGADIFAVPNNIFHSNSEGVNFLIKCGAHLASSADDILEFYGIAKKEIQKDYTPKNNLEKIILTDLKDGAKHIDDLKGRLKINITELMGILTDLEMKKVIKDIGGQRYVRI